MADRHPALTIIDNVYDCASKLARKHGMSIRTNEKSLKNDERTIFLELDGNEPEYRRGFQISNIGQGKIRIWSIVTDLADGTWNQDIRITDYANAEKDIAEVLNNVDTWIDTNADLDPLEEERKRIGTAYYWKHEHDNGTYTISTDFKDGWYAEIIGDNGYDGYLCDQNSNTVFETTGDDSVALMLQIEAEYAKLKPS